MQRDKRMGLALGILLMGIVGAFFFRNEGDSQLLPPGLSDPDKLDAQISENPVVPYLTGMERDRRTSSKPRAPARPPAPMSSAPSAISASATSWKATPPRRQGSKG